MARISFAPNESEKPPQRNPHESAGKTVGIRYQLFDTSSPFLKAHLDRSSEPAHEAMWSFDAFDDVTRQLDRLIKASADVAANNAAKARAKAAAKAAVADNLELSAWDAMVCEIAQALKSAGMSTGAKNDSSKGASNFVLLMVALTRQWPEKYRKHHSGYLGQESPDAMAKAINKALGKAMRVARQRLLRLVIYRKSLITKVGP